MNNAISPNFAISAMQMSFQFTNALRIYPFWMSFLTSFINRYIFYLRTRGYIKTIAIKLTEIGTSEGDSSESKGAIAAMA